MRMHIGQTGNGSAWNNGGADLRRVLYVRPGLLSRPMSVSLAPNGSQRSLQILSQRIDAILVAHDLLQLLLTVGSICAHRVSRLACPLVPLRCLRAVFVEGNEFDRL